MQTMQTLNRVQNADCRLGTKCRLRIYLLFFVWYVITCHLKTYRASRINRFSVIIFYDHLHYCEIFLAHFLITVVHNIISSLHIVFSLCARVDWCNVCTDFTNLIKTDVDVNKMSRAIFEKQSTALHVVRTFHLSTDFMCSVCWQKCGPRPKLFLRLDIVSTFRGVHTLIFT